MIDPDFFDGLFAGSPVMAILRGFSPAETVEKACRAWQLGIEVVEVPVEQPAAYAAFEAAVTEARAQGRTIGAGTVYRLDQVDVVLELGAAFAVAPGFDIEVSERCARAGLPYLPGVATPSEIQAALRSGHRWVKTFPARELGSAWITSVLAPFPDLRIVATGGIDADNAERFLNAGARAVAVGSALYDNQQLDRLAALI